MRRLMRDEACMLFTPLRAGAAHIMQLRPVWIEHSPPLPNDRIETNRWRAGSQELGLNIRLGSLGSKRTVCRHIPPAPGCQRGPEL